jgi:mannose/fructose-specific phosphotransferase system component IIA
MTTAPILLFTYKRLDVLKETVDALKSNPLASESDLFIFSDAAKDAANAPLVNEVRLYLKQISGFKSISITEAESNKGLAGSIIGGVSEVLNKYQSVIVLEDDLVVSRNFLNYMNAALEYYQENPDVFSISGYNIPLVIDNSYKYDVYFTPRASSWGWACWRNRWADIDWSVSDFDTVRTNAKLKQAFNKGGSDMFAMLKKAMEHKIDSWAIKWCYNQFKKGQLTVYPIVSKVENIGFNRMATNTNVYNRYVTGLDDGSKMEFSFPQNVKLESRLHRQFLDFYSLKTRFMGKLKTHAHKLNLK